MLLGDPAQLGADGVGVVQCFKNTEGPPVGGAGGVRIAGGVVGVTQVAETVGFVVAVADVPVQVEGVTVWNNCDHAVRVKVILAFHTDFPCYTIEARQARSYRWAWPGRFDRLEDC